MAQVMFFRFLKSNEPIEYRKRVPNPLDQAFFLESLQKEALEQTLRFFGSTHSFPAREFRDQILKRARIGGFGFSLTESSEAISDRPAGYVRAQGHIIMNYTVMTRDDWLFLFIHEFSHFVDPVLQNAVQSAVADYRAYPNFIAESLASLQGVHDWSELPEETQKQMDRYLELSLRRGWIGEVSAWANTLRVYADLRRLNKMIAVAWPDEMIILKPPTQSWVQFFADYLRARFTYPENAIYKNSLLRARSIQLENEILKSLE